MSKKRHYTAAPPVVEDLPEDNVAVVEAEPVDVQPEEVVPVVNTGKVTGCRLLNIRQEPNVFAEIVCAVNSGTELVVSDTDAANDFYKVCTSAGIEGYCMKRFITLQ